MSLGRQTVATYMSTYDTTVHHTKKTLEIGDSRLMTFRGHPRHSYDTQELHDTKSTVGNVSSGLVFV